MHGLGFTILEGYGLTEASPVLTVTRPQNALNATSVGTPLPGVEVRISDPDAFGIGEVIARGPNVMLGYYQNEQATQSAIISRWLHTGDLGRLDEDGNLYLVGRSKEIIVDTNGKNVYPDEIEELYKDSPYVKEIGVVGLPDGIGEKVAALVFPDYDHDIALQREEVQRRVENHFREVSSSLPFYKRVKSLYFADEELPRTATRKVKRREVVKLIQSLEESKRAGITERTAPREQHHDADWLLGIVAHVASRPRAQVTLDSRLAELGFDSLMFVELASAIEQAGGALVSPDTLNEVVDVRELYSVVKRRETAAGEARGRGARRGGRAAVGEGDLRPHVRPHRRQPRHRRGAARALRERSEGARRGAVEHPDAHELHRGDEPHVAPRHGTHQVRARRVRPRHGGARRGRLLLRQQVQARLHEQLHEHRAHRAFGKSCGSRSATRARSLNAATRRSSSPRARAR